MRTCGSTQGAPDPPASARHSRAAAQRAPRRRGRPGRIRTRVPAWLLRHRVEAQGLALSIRPLAGRARPQVPTRGLRAEVKRLWAEGSRAVRFRTDLFLHFLTAVGSVLI